MCLLYFREKIRQLDLTIYKAFKIAYRHAYGESFINIVHGNLKLSQVTVDYCKFIREGVLPEYVVDWIKYLQENERH